ncbi:YozE family protein [Fredinandcohnia humi]
MGKSFYHYIVKFRNEKAKDEISKFANDIYEDHGFPKYSKDYHDISSYLELNGDFLTSMSIFDRAWELYVEDK